MLCSKEAQGKNRKLCLGERRKISEGTNDLSKMSECVCTGVELGDTDKAGV